MNTEEILPAEWALDATAKLAGWKDWADALATARTETTDSIIAHARTLEKYEPAPKSKGELFVEEALLRFRDVGMTGDIPDLVEIVAQMIDENWGEGK